MFPQFTFDITLTHFDKFGDTVWTRGYYNVEFLSDAKLLAAQFETLDAHTARDWNPSIVTSTIRITEQNTGKVVLTTTLGNFN